MLAKDKDAARKEVLNLLDSLAELMESERSQICYDWLAEQVGNYRKYYNEEF